ncbi:hypothetical protein HMPREF9069_00478 [Atopobium sp. oral taxon 810 str. F0209]|nr:hypothetical protein HMPREF9069_00478 [Atopobium sp. oral taxon 810 str. F0209]
MCESSAWSRAFYVRDKKWGSIKSPFMICGLMGDEKGDEFWHLGCV